MCLEYWFTIDLIDRTENFAEMHLSRGLELKVSSLLPSYIELCWRIISMYFNVLSMLKIPNLHELCVPPPFPSVYIHTLQWRHNELDDVSNHQPYDCLLNRLFRRRSTKYPSCKLLRLGASGIAHHISSLINHSLQLCTFPDMFKLAEVSSLYKKNDNLHKGNYRPVSVLPSVSKIYERVMAVQLCDFFDHIFSALLSAFRKRYSCQSTLLNMIEHFKKSLDRGEYVACLSMDLSKAFDCLPHCLTICKLYAYGVSRQACILIASYLQSRKQRIKLGNSRSEWAELSKGVPQGSILGPLIFNIFLNDIFYFATESDLYNYADDNCVSVSHTEMNVLSSYLQSETQSMVKWFTDNSMRANAGKFQGIILCGGREQKTVNINVGESDICFVSKIEVLGVSIDDKLNFNDHVKRICSKASAQISALQRLTGLIDLPSRKAIYSSFIAANFNYCPLVCFFTSRKSIDMIEKIQERALRFVLRDQVSSYDVLLEKAGYESFRIHAVKLLLVEMFKIFNGLSPEYLSDIFEKSDNPYCMRDKNKLIQPLKRTTTYGLRSFEYYGSHVWNMLPVHFKSCESISEFKNSIKRWLGPRCSCSMCVALLWFDVYRASSFMHVHMFYCLCEMTMLECCI